MAAPRTGTINAFITTGHGSTQTAIGGTVAGGDVVVHDTLNDAGGLAFLGDGVMTDKTGASPKVGILNYGPLTNAFNFPADTRIVGMGTGPLSVVNDVMTIGTGTGGTMFSRDAAAIPVVISPIVPTDTVTIGPENQDFAALLLVNGTGNLPYNQLFSVVNAGTLAFTVSTSGGIGMGTNTPPTSPIVQIYSIPLQFRNQQSYLMDIPAFSIGSTTLSGYGVPYRVGNQTLYALLYAAYGAYDNFTRANSTSTLGTSTPTPGQLWTPQNGTWGITSNTGYLNATPPATSAFYTATLAGQNASGTITTTMSTVADGAGVCWRGAALNGANPTLYTCHYGSGANRYFVRFWNGGPSYLSPNVDNTALAAQNGDTIQVILSSVSPKMTVTITRTGSTSPTTIYTSDATDDGAGGFATFNGTSNLHGLKTEDVNAARWSLYSFN